MRDTQFSAWNDIQDSIGAKRLRVLNVIKSSEEGKTNFEIARTLSIPINQVTGRVRELCESGLVEDSSVRRVNPDSGKNGIVWKEVENPDYKPFKSTNYKKLYLEALDEIKTLKAQIDELKEHSICL